MKNKFRFLAFMAALAVPSAGLAEQMLVYTDMARDDTALSIVAARPGERHVVGTLDVLPGMEPFSRMSQDGRSLFMARHTDFNHPERSALLYRFDLVERRMELVAEGVDAVPPQPLGPRSVAWFETTDIHPVDEERAAMGELFSVDMDVMGSFDGQKVRLARFEGVYGAHFAGLTEDGVVLYVVSRAEAAFYVLPLERALADRASGVIRGRTPDRSPLVPAAIESKSSAVPPSGIIRVGKAPAGPFARDFTISGKTLLFGSLNGDRTTKGLYGISLDSVAADALRRDGTLAADLDRMAVQIESTGMVHPSPLAVGDRLLFSRSEKADADGREPDSHLVTGIRLDHGAISSEGLQDMARDFSRRRQKWESKGRLADGLSNAPAVGEKGGGTSVKKSASVLERREMVRIRGRGRVVASPPDGSAFVVEHVFRTDGKLPSGGDAFGAELLWIDPETRQSVRMPVDEIHDVLGFAEVTP